MLKKILIASMCLSAVYACGDDNDETLNFNPAIVQESESFVDSRDNNEYKCVRVGNQIWMAENLRYILPLGPLDGCYTWNEELVVASKLELNLAGYKQALSDTFYKIPEQEGMTTDEYWPEKCGSSNPVYKMMFTMLMEGTYLRFDEYGMPQAALNETLSGNFPGFYSVFQGELGKSEYDQYRSVAAIKHIQDQEELNGHYSEKYGYLYSYAGALSAVPTEGGWRLPSDEDWTKLETALGMNGNEATNFESWRGAGVGDLLKEGGASGLNLLLSGGNLYTEAKEDCFILKDEGGYYWTSTIHYQGELAPDQEVDDKMTEQEKAAALKTTVIMRSLAVYSNQVWRGTIRANTSHHPVTCSVRLVRDVN